MGCGASKAVFTVPKDEETKVGPAAEVPKAVAFEIPADTEDERRESIVKKHPPKRLQRLEEQSSTTLTAEEIAEKQRQAEERRQELLEEKIQKAKTSQGGKEASSDSSKVSPSTVSFSDLRTILLLAEELTQLILKCSLAVIHHVISSETNQIYKSKNQIYKSKNQNCKSEGPIQV